MQSIEFVGASGEVTGSCYVLTNSQGTKVLIDFGMFQGPDEVVRQNYEKLPFNPAEISAVFLTHAHLDHCGRLPMLIYRGFSGKIFMTKPTVSLLDVVLVDSARVAQENMEYEPLYTMDEVDKVFKLVQVVDYDEEIRVAGFSVVFKDAGHILGSASVRLTDQTSNTSIIFSGDLGNTPEDIVKPTEYFTSSDYVVMESTYGNSQHPDEDVSGIIEEEIHAIEKDSGVLLIPAFSLERTQEILHRINHLKSEGKVSSHIPVFLDSPMGIRATLIYRHFKSFYNQEIQSHTGDPFSFEGLVVIDDARDSKAIVKAMTPKIIIAGSGMMTGGRILHHAFNYLSQPETRLLFVGYQAEETLGREILEGAKVVRINDKPVKVKAKLREIKTLSSHADQPKLLDWLGHIKGVQQVFLTHGEQPERVDLKAKIEQDLGIKDTSLPLNGDTINLR